MSKKNTYEKYIDNKIGKKKVNLTVEEIKQLMNLKNKEKKQLPYYLQKPPQSEESPEPEEFTYHVKKCGNSSHIQIGKRWLNRFVKVRLEEVKEE